VLAGNLATGNAGCAQAGTLTRYSKCPQLTLTHGACSARRFNPTAALRIAGARASFECRPASAASGLEPLEAVPGRLSRGNRGLKRPAPGIAP